MSALLVLLAFLLGVVAGRLSLLVESDVERAIDRAERDEERWVG